MKGCLYCARCDKSIPKEEFESRSKQLLEKFGNESLLSGKCPVCGTTLIDMDKVEKKK